MALSNEALAISKLFFISPKEGGSKVPFYFNTAQRMLDEQDVLYDHLDMIIAKARQKGFSSAIEAKFGIRCLGREGTHAVTISHEGEATQRLFDRVHFYLKHMVGPKPSFGRVSRNEIYFEKTESTYYIGTAGAKAFGRGDTVTDLHCSEYAFWENPTIHSAGLFEAVPYKGRKYIESTGNGRRNDFYYIWKHAKPMGYTRLFCPWYVDQEYSLQLPPHHKQWHPDLPSFNSSMREMQHRHKLSDQQMYWYEMKLRSKREDIKEMQQEYPATPEECFQATSEAVFDPLLSSDHKWQETKVEGYYAYKLQNHPVSNFHYVAGGDPSGGTGGDDAAIVIVCVETGEQVLELANNTIHPLQFGRVISALGETYSSALLVVEANNHGAAVIPYLTENYPKQSIYKRRLATRSTPAKYGWQNSNTSKHALVGLMQEELEALHMYGQKTITELEDFEEHEGKLSGKSDNLVIATGLAMLGYKKWEHFRLEYEDSLKPPAPPPERSKSYMYYTLDDIIDSIGRKQGIPIQQRVQYLQ